MPDFVLQPRRLCSGTSRTDVHVVSGTDCFFLFLDLAAVQVGNLTLYRFDGFHLIHRLNVHTHNERAFHIQKISQQTVIQLRCENLQKRNSPVFLAHTELLAKELRICEQRVTAAFKKLVELKLVWEKRCGRGDANQIYLARVTPIEDPDYSCAPFITEDESEVRGSRTAKSAFPEPQKLTPSKKEKRKIDQSHMEVRPSVRAPAQDGRTDGDAEEELLDILDGCELECFAPETALVFENAIERLFYADSFRIGNATLPQSRVRAKLRRLDGMILREAESKLRANQERNVKNSTAYTMAVLFNYIAESESDLMIDPYLNAICAVV